jgi:hypothetical protein
MKIIGLLLIALALYFWWGSCQWFKLARSLLGRPAPTGPAGEDLRRRRAASAPPVTPPSSQKLWN